MHLAQMVCMLATLLIFVKQPAVNIRLNALDSIS